MARVKPNKYDQAFSKWIRNRANWTCERCGGQYEPPTRALHCSHYWKRGKHATRFSPDNCMALCYGCHVLLEGDKQGEYKSLMINKLGQIRFDQLTSLANTMVKKRQAEEAVWEWLKEE